MEGKHTKLMILSRVPNLCLCEKISWIHVQGMKKGASRIAVASSGCKLHAFINIRTWTISLIFYHSFLVYLITLFKLSIGRVDIIQS
jgi:hypothetical protein